MIQALCLTTVFASLIKFHSGFVSAASFLSFVLNITYPLLSSYLSATLKPKYSWILRICPTPPVTHIWPPPGPSQLSYISLGDGFLNPSNFQFSKAFLNKVATDKQQIPRHPIFPPLLFRCQLVYCTQSEKHWCVQK